MIFFACLLGIGWMFGMGFLAEWLWMNWGSWGLAAGCGGLILLNGFVAWKAFGE